MREREKEEIQEVDVEERFAHKCAGITLLLQQNSLELFNMHIHLLLLHRKAKSKEIES